MTIARVEPVIRSHESHEAWLKARSAGVGIIGCSDLAALLGVSRFRGPWDVYAERVLGVRREPTPQQAADQRRGQALERYVLEEYALRTGYRLFGVGERLIVSSPAIPWLRGSPDALVDGGADGLGGADAKTSRDAWEWATDGAEIEAWSAGSERLLPPDMALQGYGYMALTGRAWWDFPVLLPFYEIRTIRLHRDEQVIGSMLETAEGLVRRHLIDGIAPDIDASEACRRAVEARWQAGRAEALAAKATPDATPEQAEALLTYAQAHAAAKEATEAKDRAANVLREAMRGAYGIRVGVLKVTNGNGGLRLAGGGR